MVIKRNRRKHVLSFEERLSSMADHLRLEAEQLQPGPEREALLHKVAQHETALDLAKMLRQPGQYFRHE